jgi:hypothetical protein
MNGRCNRDRRLALAMSSSRHSATIIAVVGLQTTKVHAGGASGCQGQRPRSATYPGAMNESVELASQLSPSAILLNIANLPMWVTATGERVPPFAPQAYRVRTSINGHHFTLTVRAQRLNSFAPVCVGSVVRSAAEGASIHAHFRFHWFTRLIIALWCCGLIWILYQPVIKMKVELLTHTNPRIDAWVAIAFLVGIAMAMLIEVARLASFGSRLDEVRMVSSLLLKQCSIDNPQGIELDSNID